MFAQPEGEVGAPVESPFGWHLFQVSAIEPEVVKPLAEVHDELAKELALAEARERLPGFATQLDDELAAGTPLPEAAAAVGLTAKTLAAVDRQGRDPGGAAPADLPSWPELLETAFATPEGEVEPARGDGYGQLLRGAGGQRDGAARQAGRGGARCAGGGLAGGATQSSSQGSGPRRCSAGPAR